MKRNPEDVFLQKILPGLPAGADLVLGPGDDCAAVRVRGSKDLLLLKTDGVVEGVHFLREENPARVGWKALCRPLSDVAAMGGIPAHALITLLTPRDVPSTYWRKFYQGVRKAARRFGLGIAGGEISHQPSQVAVTVSLTGWVSPKNLITRAGGRPGDILFVTGRLGGSLAGHHLDFIPRLAEGQWLAARFHPTAMMDLSDGLGSDLPRLAHASECGFEVEDVPARRGMDRNAALTDGEDYELLFAVSPRRAEALAREWKQAFPKTPLTKIGRLTDSNTAPADWPGGWDHFSVVSRPASRQPEH